MAGPGRPLTAGVKRPVCPKGHTGRIWLDGRRISGKGRFERTRWRCVPDEDRWFARRRLHGPHEHVFLAPLALRRETREGTECAACERPFERAEGLAGARHFSFAVREAATALVRIGRGDAYRRISRDLRRAIGRTSARGKRRGKVAPNGALAMDYADIFGPAIASAHAPTRWPAIVALDALPIRVRDHSECCPGQIAQGGLRRPRHPGPSTPRDESGHVRRPKIRHPAPIRETGRILFAVGYERPGDLPRPWLIRFAGGGDQVSWEEFLRTLPGTPEWVVSDRDQAITGALRAVWRDAPIHYLCEQHLAQNAAEAAREDGLNPREGVLREILEQAQFGPEEWARAEGAAAAFGAARLGEWLERNRDTAQSQFAKRAGRGLYPRSAGACEAVIRDVECAIEYREQYFANADRFNLLLALVRAELDGAASVGGYSRLIRSGLAGTGGRSNADWGLRRDPDGFISSIELLLADAATRAREGASRRRAPVKARRYRGQHVDYEAGRALLGLPPAPRGRPRTLRAAPGSLVGGTSRTLAGWSRSGTRGATASAIRGTCRRGRANSCGGAATPGRTTSGRRRCARARCGAPAAPSARTASWRHPRRSRGPTPTSRASGTPRATAPGCPATSATAHITRPGGSARSIGATSGRPASRRAPRCSRAVPTAHASPAGAADPVGCGSARPRRPSARGVPARPHAPAKATVVLLIRTPH